MDLNIAKKNKTQTNTENLFTLCINIDLIYCIIVSGQLGWDDLKSLMLACKYLYQLIQSYDLKKSLYTSRNPGFSTWFTLYKYVRDVLEEIVLPVAEEKKAKLEIDDVVHDWVEYEDVITLYVHNTNVKHFMKGEYLSLGVGLGYLYEHPNGTPRLSIFTKGSAWFDLLSPQYGYKFEPVMVDEGQYELNTNDIGLNNCEDEVVWKCLMRNIKEWYNGDGIRIATHISNELPTEEQYGLFDIDKKEQCKMLGTTSHVTDESLNLFTRTTYDCGSYFFPETECTKEYAYPAVYTIPGTEHQLYYYTYTYDNAMLLHLSPHNVTLTDESYKYHPYFTDIHKTRRIPHKPSPDHKYYAFSY